MCVCIVTLLASCQKQEIAVEPQVNALAEVDLSQDKLLRLQLLSSNCTRSKDDVLNAIATSLPFTFTKSARLSISDSLVYGQKTKSSNHELLVLYLIYKRDSVFAVNEDDLCTKY